MKNLKTLIIFLILFIAIGFAIVSTSLSINGETSIAGNPDDFFVYYSDINSTSTNKTLELNTNSPTSFSFGATMSEIGENIKIDFNVVNSSKNYDAEVSINCTGGDEYVSINSSIANNNIEARKETTGYIQATVQKSYVGDTGAKQNITCTLNAIAIERDSISDSPIIELQPINTEFPIGKEITIGTEKFNIISQTKNTVSLFAQYNLGPDYKQSTSKNYVTFSDTSGWTYNPGPLEIDIQSFEGNVKQYVNEYTSYIKEIMQNDKITGDLISMQELATLQCIIPVAYSWKADGNYRTCINSPYTSWLITDQKWWTKSAVSSKEADVWMHYENGSLYHSNCDSCTKKYGVRPVITMPKSALTKEIIEFYIEGVTYQAEEGMYWSEWVASKYNTGGFELYQDETNFRVHLGASHYFYNDNAIYDSIIIEEKNYTKTYSELL